MPLFLIERTFAEQIEASEAHAAEIRRVNDDVGAVWLYSFLSADRKRTYCLYEAPSAEAIREAARRLGSPVDTIIELTGTLRPDGSLATTVPI